MNKRWVKYVRRVLWARGLKQFQIAQKGGFDASNFPLWWKGHLPSRDLAEKFAIGSGEDTTVALVHAGYVPYPEPQTRSQLGLTRPLARAVWNLSDDDDPEIRSQGRAFLEGLVQAMKEGL